jgi:dTDP-4-amino-4,6-dideoxygalactose transaminase
LNVKLPYLLEWNDQRRALAERYSDLLSSTPLTIPKAAEEDRVSSFHLYVVRCRDRAERDRLAAELRTNKIETGIHYPTPLHLQLAFAFLGHAKGQFPVAEQAAETMLSLPIFPGMYQEEQDRVVDAILRFFG